MDREGDMAGSLTENIQSLKAEVSKLKNQLMTVERESKNRWNFMQFCRLLKARKFHLKLLCFRQAQGAATRAGGKAAKGRKLATSTKTSVGARKTRTTVPTFIRE